MPTFQWTPRFSLDWKALTEETQDRFQDTVRDKFVPDLIRRQFRQGLRVKPVQG